jgi:hypothetical protein
MVSCDTAIPADRARGTRAKQQAMWTSGDLRPGSSEIFSLDRTTVSIPVALDLQCLSV